MLKKLQIKLLSDAGELLHVVTCTTGNVSVFRAHTATDLRPYQRALAGIPTKERFVIVEDGEEYNTTHHNLIGFGEGPLATHSTTLHFLIERGCSEESATALLLSLGLEKQADQACALLSADEERRLQILAATLEPQKVLVINEPFEPISSQWRERTADTLASFARTQGGMVIVTGLSYRPESWIDNEYVARIQVGQTLQRTIGFGAAGSTANAFMNELKNQLRAEQQQEASVQPVAIAAGAAMPISATALGDNNAQGAAPETANSLAASASVQAWHILRTASLLQRVMAITAIGAIALGSSSLFTRTEDASPSKNMSEIAKNEGPHPPLSEPKSSADNSPAIKSSSEHPVQVAALSLPTEKNSGDTTRVEPKAKVYILDHYPEGIRESLLATVRGIAVETTEASASNSEVRSVPGSTSAGKDAPGNIFSLLEQAGSEESSQPGGAPDTAWGRSSAEVEAPPVDWSNDGENYEEPQEAESRREAIREKFLEAIRAAADRRENEIGGME